MLGRETYFSYRLPVHVRSIYIIVKAKYFYQTDNLPSWVMSSFLDGFLQGDVGSSGGADGISCSSSSASSFSNSASSADVPTRLPKVSSISL